MNATGGKHRFGKTMAAVLAMLLALCAGQSALGAYFATRTLTLTVSPNLSGVPTPTPVPTVTPTPTPTAAPGNGLVFDNAASMISVNWRSPYSGTLTGLSMTADNVKHNLSFALEFTAPDWFTQDTPSWQQTLLDGFSMRLAAVNTYGYAIGLDAFGSNNAGTGTLQLGSLNMQPSERKTDIVMNFWSSGLQLPTYQVTGNKIVIQTNQSYTFIGYNVPEQNNVYKRDKYTYSATITIIVPSHVATPTPSPSPTPSPTPTPTPTITPTAAPVSTATPEPTATVTPEPTAEPTATVAPETTVQSVTEATPGTEVALQSVTDSAESQTAPPDTPTAGAETATP